MPLYSYKIYTRIIIEPLAEKAGGFYCLNTLHSYEFDGSAGFDRMQAIMQRLRAGSAKGFGGKGIVKTLDYQRGLDGLPASNVVKFLLEDHCSVVVRPSGTEPKLKAYISVSTGGQEEAKKLEKAMAQELSGLLSQVGTVTLEQPGMTAAE